MWRGVWAAGVSAALASASCGAQNSEKYAQAAIGTSAVLVATGVSRAVSKSCWANCSTGYACNESTGLCELGECLPGCEVGTHCVRDTRDITYCARDGNPVLPPKSAAIAPPPR